MFPISLRSKRAQLALRFLTYGVMTIATVALTVLAIFYAMGYRFNQSSLVFEQGGLAQFRSFPDGATVVVNGSVQNFKTPGRANLTSGTHTVSMQLDGYREWRRTVSMAPGQLLWLNYTRFIPNSVTTVPMKTFPSIAGVLPSPDHRWMVLQEKGEAPAFTLADFNNEKDPVYTNIAIPDSKITKASDGKYGLIGLVEWDLGSRYFLVHQQNGSTNDWLRVDRAKPEETVNISQTFKLNITDAQFAGSNPNIIYTKTDGVLRRLDIGGNSASAALVDGLESFEVYGDDTVSFVATRLATPNNAASAQKIVGVYKNGKETIAKRYPIDTPLKTAFGQYADHSFLAINKGDGNVQIVRDPTDGGKDMTDFGSFGMAKTIEWLKMSNNGRMVTAGAGNSVVTFDLELRRPYESNLAFLGESGVRPMRWLDDFYLWSDMGDKLRIVEFDGLNEREITTIAPGYDITLSPTGKTLFSIGKNTVTNNYFLQGSQLVKE